MHLFEVAFYTAGTLYALFTQQILIFYFLLVVGAYIVIGQVLPGAKNISIRKKIMVSTWTPPSEGVISVRLPIRMDKTLKLIDSLPKQNRPTLTHFAVKALGELLHKCPDVNGKLVFGKFVPFETADVSCLVDIDGGKDLAIVLVEDVGKKSVYEIADFIRGKGSNIKEKKGDGQHKKRTGVAKFLPAFMVTILIKASNFIFHYLGVSIKPLALKKNQFGSACLTSLGMIGFEDATAPFTGFTGCTILAALNAVHDEPVADDGKVVIAKVANVNFVVDHRYVDGGKCKHLVATFKRVFEAPEEYLRSNGRPKEQAKKDN